MRPSSAPSSSSAASPRGAMDTASALFRHVVPNLGAPVAVHSSLGGALDARDASAPSSPVVRRRSPPSPRMDGGAAGAAGAAAGATASRPTSGSMTGPVPPHAPGGLGSPTKLFFSLVAETAAAPLAGVAGAMGAGDKERAADPCAPSKASVLHRLGGCESLRRIVDGVMLRVQADQRLHRHFSAAFTEHMMSRKVYAYLEVQLGGRVAYTGPSLFKAHEKVGVTPDEFDALLAHFQSVLVQEQVPLDVAVAVLDALGAVADPVTGSGCWAP